MTPEAIDRNAVLLREQLERRAGIDRRATLSHAAVKVHDDVRDAELVHPFQGGIAGEGADRGGRGVEVPRGEAAVSVDDRVTVLGGVDHVAGVAEEGAPPVEGQFDHHGIRLVPQTIEN